MPSTLIRYFLKRWTFPLLGALFFFGGLIMANEILGITKEIFTQGAPFRWMVPLLLTQVPETLGTVLPMAAVLGGMLGTQHLSEGSEMVASQGLGVGRRSLVNPWILMSIGLLLVASLNAHFLVPQASSARQAIETTMMREAQARNLRPGAAPWFPSGAPNDAVWMAPNGEMHLLESSPKSAQHIVAKRFQWNLDESDAVSPTIKLRLEDLQGGLIQKNDGSIVNLDHQQYQIISIKVPSTFRVLPPLPTRYQSTAWLLARPSVEARLELSRRFALPMASCALLLVGIALGFGHPRFQKGGAILKSLGVILGYYLLMKYLENQFLSGKIKTTLPLFLLPLIFLGMGWLLLGKRLRPHRAASRLWALLVRFARLEWTRLARIRRRLRGRLRSGIRLAPRRAVHSTSGSGVLGRWTRALWWKSWGAAVLTLLTLSLLIEYANLAGDLAHNHVSLLVFLHYWIWNLPPFLAIVLPIAFLLGGVLVFSEAATSQEWVALRAGGVSLVRWVRSSAAAWGTVILATFLLQAWLAPPSFSRADALYRRILNRPARIAASKPWLNLGSTGIVWYMEGTQRWGFPLCSPGEGAPVLLHWTMGEPRVEALPWKGLRMVQGPEAERLFPDRALREVANPESASTLDLFRWQRWAPDPERASMLWDRLLNWLAGPCLLFAALAHAFPAPRKGRGQALGLSLVAGLLFLGLQALFGGAAKAGEIPAAWGVLAPLLVLLGTGLARLHKLST